jgi:FkbM family methyltransferase
MIVNTRRLFAKLLSRMQISAVCDVGSMNGVDALAFRDAVPHASVYAFEPNPANFGRMQAERVFRERNIELVPLAVTNYCGEAEFFLVEADYSQSDPRRGMSSLHRRRGEWAPAAVASVGTTRLDTFLADRCPSPMRLALWIDTEGKAYEAIEGVSALAGQIYLVHIEVETSPCIGPGQKLYLQVKTLLRQLGLAEVATDNAPSQVQFNALFVRRDLPAAMRLRVSACLVRGRLRYLLARLVGGLCPTWVRRFRAMWFRIASSASRSGG